MPGSWVVSVLQLVRLRNLILTAVGVAIGGVLAQGHAVFPPVVLWAILSAVGLGAAGNVSNDLADRGADRINRPDRPLVTGAVSVNAALLIGGIAGGLGLVIALWISRELFLLGLAALIVMLVYSPLLKRHGAAGNLAVAIVASLPIVYGATAVGWWRAGVLPAAMAALLHLAREIVKDVEDVAGDVADGRRTLPIAFGTGPSIAVAVAALVIFVPVSLAPWFAGWYGRRYGIAVAVLDVFVLLLIVRLSSRHLGGARSALKTAMLVGMVALLWDRL